ncbi:MAG: hypothetical protein P3W90_004040 [Paracoccus sp. (in: a-proteobacteria)]|nr:hypothetical protein [Paracoccus sp. (in: a-proteobacteria)]
MSHTLRDRLADWAEVFAAAAALAGALWVFGLGGWLFWPIGALAGFAALVWLVTALNRRRLARPIAAPGVIEIDEGRLRYFGARVLGGEMALADLAEIRLLRLSGRICWRLKSAGEALLIPVDASGASALTDALGALPGLDLGQLASALRRAETGVAVQVVWTRAKGADRVDLA